MAEESVRIPQVGEVIAGKYRLKRLLGEGGMGSVLEAEHLKLRQPIAIKFLNPSMLGVDEIVKRFEREARAAATLRSRHVVRVTDVEVTPEGVPYMVMELLHGGDLEAEREQRKQLPHTEAVNYVLQACGALVEAHDAGIVHRDLKPGNLFLAREDGDRVIVKVLDFGISKFLKGDDSDAKLTSAGAIMGTALYMSPEQIRGDGSIDARSDIWSLGVILYELISGNAPWIGPTTRVAAAIVAESVPDLIAQCPGLPEGLALAIYRMLEKSPANRPSSIVDVALALAPYAPAGSVGAEVAETLARRSQRNLAPFSPSSQQQHLDSSHRHGAASPAFTTPMMSAPPGSLTPAGSAAVSARVPSAHEQRSTMAATTTSHDLKLGGRPRAVWGVLAGLATLGLVGLGLIIFITRAKSTTTDANANANANANAPTIVATTPSNEQLPTPTPTPTETETASAVPSSVASSIAKPPPIATGGGAAAATPTKKSGLAVREFPSSSPPTTPPPTSKTAGKPTETSSPPPINPPFLK